MRNEPQQGISETWVHPNRCWGSQVRPNLLLRAGGQEPKSGAPAPQNMGTKAPGPPEEKPMIQPQLKQMMEKLEHFSPERLAEVDFITRSHAPEAVKVFEI